MSKKEASQDKELVEKSYTVREILKSPIQVVFLIAGIITVSGLYPFTKGIYDFRQEAQAKKPEDYEFPKMTDFWMTIVAACISMPLEYILSPIF